MAPGVVVVLTDFAGGARLGVHPAPLAVIAAVDGEGVVAGPVPLLVSHPASGGALGEPRGPFPEPTIDYWNKEERNLRLPLGTDRAAMFDSETILVLFTSPLILKNS